MKNELIIPDGYSLPEKARKLVNRTIAKGHVLNIVALSCPDYASSDDVYTFEGQLGEGVPLLTKLHCNAIEQAIDGIEPDNIHIEILVADIESENTHLVDLYTNGDHDEYKRRCDVSMQKVGDYLQGKFPEIETIASSFMRLEDEGGTFVDYRNKYFDLLMTRFNCDRSFSLQVANSVRAKQRSGYFTQEYGGRIEPDGMFQQELLTMAEYLTLGCLIGRRVTLGAGVQLLISHATSNAHLFNKMSEYSPEKFGYDINSQRIPLMLREIPVVATTTDIT